MAINPNPRIVAGYANVPPFYYDCEEVDVSLVDYEPVDAQGNPVVIRGVMIQSGGDLAVRTEGGADIIFSPSLSTRVIYPMAITKIYSATTNATNIYVFT